VSGSSARSERRWSPRAPGVRFRRHLTITATLALCLAASGCTATAPDAARHAGSGQKGTIVVGVSGAFTENQIVAEIYAQVLEHAGYAVERQLDLPSREVSQYALESGQIDLKPEYLSSLLLFMDPNAEASSDLNDVAMKARALLEPKGIELLLPSPAQDTNQFVANPETAQRFGLTTLTSLAAVANQLTVGAPPECPQRPLCLTGLRDAYGIVFNDFEPLDVGGPQTVAALKSNEVQIALLFSTDPSIDANGFVPLLDDKQLQNAENITPVIRSDALNGDVRHSLDAVSARLSTERVTAFVGQVVMDGEDIASVASEFLNENGLL
jgi:osmoprotectant transport system substrate-binding protein